MTRRARTRVFGTNRTRNRNAARVYTHVVLRISFYVHNAEIDILDRLILRSDKYVKYAYAVYVEDARRFLKKKKIPRSPFTFF